MMKIKKKKKRKNGETRFWACHKGRPCSYPLGAARIYTIYTNAPECPSLKGSDGVGLLKASVHRACTTVQILTTNNEA